MNNLIIKICGITQLEITHYLIDQQIDMMGLIFYTKSPRYITIQKAHSIIEQLGDKRKKIKITGVFVNENMENIQSIADELNLDYLQLHGQENKEYIEKLNKYAIIKALRINDDFMEEELLDYPNKNIKYFLLDTFQKGKMGGTGKTFNWNKKLWIKKYNNIILSGGLNHDNISEALKLFDPIGVDINSGVEDSPGIKNKDKIEDIINIINRE